MERHAGGSRSIPSVHQRRPRREAVGSPATDEAAKHHRNTTVTRSTPKLSQQKKRFQVCLGRVAGSGDGLGAGLGAGWVSVCVVGCWVVGLGVGD